MQAYTDKKNDGNPNPSQWIDITVEESQTFIDVLIVSGRNRGMKLHITEMWTENAVFKQPYFSVVLSRYRFK
ncbi:hypothetical protein NQ314_009628 [Rhamnusium bicolor]|uniref:PiggyBac transposable element-derived protein domain-containing protein n=1 Tax=Rhamnusium bicolor TaxID=1586634 RepID=A0AAV8XXG5_9CUCU|nr:hypothetical protein NQ314_009628 [Rhamnusium bicolor]